jgi:flagella basal body P-ring formation protein FlgA
MSATITVLALAPDSAWARAVSCVEVTVPKRRISQGIAFQREDVRLRKKGFRTLTEAFLN